MAEFHSLGFQTDVGSGWVASMAYVHHSGTPIILIRFVRNGTSERARLDLDKRAFIDSLPDGTVEDAGTLVAKDLEIHLEGAARSRIRAAGC